MKCYAIADLQAAPTEDFFERVGRLVHAGADYIQLRAKAIDDGRVLEYATRIADSFGAPGTELLINGRADIALLAGADGVHLPSRGLPAAAIRQLMPEAMVGRSCHTLDECRQAAAEEVDYVLFGPVFETRSKVSGALVEISELRQAVDLGLAVFALGGLTRERVGRLKGIGLAGVAAVTMFMDDEPLEEIVREVRQS